MTTKEYLIKTTFDDAGMNQFQQDAKKSQLAAQQMGLAFTDAARVIDQNVSTSLDKAGATIRTVTSIMEENGKRARVSFQDMGNSIKNVSASFQTAGNVAGTFSGHLSTLISRALIVVPVWEAMRAAIQGVERVFSETIHFMIEWQTQLAKIALVSGATKEQIDILSGSLLGLSEKFGISAEEMGKTANEWLRMGATMQDVIPLLEQTSKLTLISGKSMEESAKSINILRSAFNMSTEDVSKSIDKLIGIQSASGVSLEVLLEGFDKASIKAHQMGVSFDQLAGYIAAVNEKSRQGGEAIGTQLNMMFNRMGTNAVQLAQNLSGVAFYLDATGKATTTTTGQLRNTNDILMDLAGSWNNLSNTQQNALAKTLGSARQVTTFISLMENFNAAVKASGTSVGESQKDLSKVLDTVDNKIKQVQGAWATFSQAVSQTGVIQAFLGTVKRNVDNMTTAIVLAHAEWDKLFNRGEFDKKIAAFKQLQDAQDKVNQKTQIVNTPGQNLVKETISSSFTEEQVKSKIQEIEEKALLTRQDALVTIKEELAVLGNGITLDGKNLGNQIQALTVKREKLELERQLLQLNENNTIIEARMKAEGASQLQLAIQKLAYLKETHATLEEISKQETVVQTAGIEQYKNIQDEIINALTEEQKITGETQIQLIENKIHLEDQLGIHLQGLELLKQQLDLYKAINDQANKTPQERLRDLQALIKKTGIAQRGPQGEALENAETQASKRAEKLGISEETINSILHPDQLQNQGGKNSLQDSLKTALTDPLGTNINTLSKTIADLADSITHSKVNTLTTDFPNYVTTGNKSTINSPQVNQQRQVNNTPVPHMVAINLGGVRLTIMANNKEDLKKKIAAELSELIAQQLVTPGTKISNATKQTIENF